MDVRVKFLGGAGSVTGSKYLLELDNFKLLVDCGLFQGPKELRLRNWDTFPIEPEKIDAVVITMNFNTFIPAYLESFDLFQSSI